MTAPDRPPITGSLPHVRDSVDNPESYDDWRDYAFSDETDGTPYPGKPAHFR
jgi:hypothetical protein